MWDDHEECHEDPDLPACQVLAVLTYIFEQAVYVGRHYQPLCHTAIAVNRLTAIAAPLNHAIIWRRRNVILVLVAMAITAVLLTGVPSIYWTVVYSRFTPKQLFEYEGLGWVHRDTNSVLRAANLVVCSVTAFISNLVTLAMLSVRRSSVSGQEIRLFGKLHFAVVRCAKLAIRRNEFCLFTGKIKLPNTQT